MQKVSKNGHMAKLVDALDLGSSGETHQSSSLCMPTISDIFTRITILPYGVCEQNKKTDILSVFYFDSTITIAAQ